mmetsp:Transcript_5844/g.6032  ORF Transcript_5844/g.6032 Transcript_5844/m.6032 type:complete len:97 (+) Transcript_5844:103-393(+)
MSKLDKYIDNKEERNRYLEALWINASDDGGRSISDEKFSDIIYQIAEENEIMPVSFNDIIKESKTGNLYKKDKYYCYDTYEALSKCIFLAFKRRNL